MKRTLHFWGNLVLVVFFSGFLVACASYFVYRPNVDRANYSKMDTKDWLKLDKSNILVVHNGDQMMELFDVSFAEESNQVSGKLRAFQGLPEDEYNRIIDKGSREKIKRENSLATKQAIKQVHFWLVKEFDTSKREITFNLTEVYFIGVSENKIPDGQVFAIVIGGILVGILVGGSIFLYSLSA